MSMGWADTVLLAMGPLGIMTVIVSAIRFGGIKRLKAIVGRYGTCLGKPTRKFLAPTASDNSSTARESQSTAEQEVLSSTSKDVCEPWSGEEIVGLISSPQGMKCIILTNEGGIYDLKTASEAGVITLTHNIYGIEPNTDQIAAALASAAPNLALNVKNANAPA
ncbi:hypothetical protein B0H63DRAFT_477575 [Podospora didyma]|uniref:Uncharacterized protein n=1 Tax=Podospora didyma TaxID=330526 RepID=A0AAE0KK00_9PEZI|nr:hypothetical protein B0H63DRAFT_477575 [Podospora didyma]